MARKSKSILPTDLDLDAARAGPGAAERPAFLQDRAGPLQASTPVACGIKATTVATTLYLMPSDHKRLRVLAIDRNASMQTLLLDALDMLMADAGQAPVTRWETRRKDR